MTRSLERIGPCFLLAAIFWLGSGGRLEAQPVGLGEALNFALIVNHGNLSMGSHGIVKGANVGVYDGQITLAYQSHVWRDLVDSGASPAVITLGASSHVIGECATDAGGAIQLTKGADCGSQNTSGSSAQVADLNQAIIDLEKFDSALDGLAATQTLAAGNQNPFDDNDVVVKDHQHVKVNLPNRKGNNKYDKDSVTIGEGGSIDFEGGGDPGVELTLVIHGTLSIGGNGRIKISNGLNANHVKIKAAEVDLSGTAQVKGTLDSDSACNLGTEVTIDGALYCGGDATIGPLLRLNFVPCEVTI